MQYQLFFSVLLAAVTAVQGATPNPADLPQCAVCTYKPTSPFLTIFVSIYFPCKFDAVILKRILSFLVWTRFQRLPKHRLSTNRQRLHLQKPGVYRQFGNDHPKRLQRR